MTELANSAFVSMTGIEFAFAGRTLGLRKKLSTTIKPGINGMRPVHPGEVLREEFLRPLEMSVVALAGALRMAPSQIDEIIQERGAVTADTAIRLARYFGGR